MRVRTSALTLVALVLIETGVKSQVRPPSAPASQPVTKPNRSDYAECTCRSREINGEVYVDIITVNVSERAIEVPRCPMSLTVAQTVGRAAPLTTRASEPGLSVLVIGGGWEKLVYAGDGTTTVPPGEGIVKRLHLRRLAPGDYRVSIRMGVGYVSPEPFKLHVSGKLADDGKSLGD